MQRPVNRVVKQRIEELEDAEAKLGNVIKENTDLKLKVSELEG
jgi:regulator of replication initiation timing